KLWAQWNEMHPSASAHLWLEYYEKQVRPSFHSDEVLNQDSRVENDDTAADQVKGEPSVEDNVSSKDNETSMHEAENLPKRSSSSSSTTGRKRVFQEASEEENGE